MLSTDEGWKFRIAIATDEKGSTPEAINLLRAKLRERCASLNEDDLAYGVGIGRGYLANQLPYCPLILGANPSMTGDQNSDLYLKHYWFKRFGFVWNSDNLLSQMENSKLADVKKLLAQIIDESNVRIL